MIEINGTKPAVGGMFGIGIFSGVIGAVTLANQRLPVIGSAILLALGLVLVVVAVHALITQKLQLRASEQGVAFARSQVIPWSEVSQIFVGRVKSPLDRFAKVPALVAIDFHRKRTLFRLPLTFWISSPFAIGHVDIALYKMNEPPDSIVAHLEALRVKAVGSVDGVVAGTSELPAAKVMKRDR